MQARMGCVSLYWIDLLYTDVMIRSCCKTCLDNILPNCWVLLMFNYFNSISISVYWNHIRMLEGLNQIVKFFLGNGYDHVINVEQVSDVIHMLKKEKKNLLAVKFLWSYILRDALHIFKVHMTLYITWMHVYGYTSESMLNGTTISLPQNGLNDKCISDNYWGIYICSCMTNTYMNSC